MFWLSDNFKRWLLFSCDKNTQPLYYSVYRTEMRMDAKSYRYAQTCVDRFVTEV